MKRQPDNIQSNKENKPKKRASLVKKAGNSLFGRLTFIGLSILFQFALLLVVGIYFYSYFAIIQVVSAVLALVAFLRLETRDMVAEMKVPWCFLILFFPLFGSFVYFLLGEPHLSPRRKKILKNIYRVSLPFSYSGAPLSQEEAEEGIGDPPAKGKIKKTALRLIEEDGGGQARYLARATGLVPYEKCYTRYFPDGESFWESLCEEIAKAEKFVFLEYFIVEDGKMLGRILDLLAEKSAQGVDVRLLYDDIGSVGKVPFFYPELLKKRGINCLKFNHFVPVLTAVQNNRDHRKIAVIDGKCGFIGGTNLADEYINAVRRFGNWKDSSLLVKGEAVRSLTLMFLQLWSLQREETEDFSPFLAVEAGEYEEEGTVQPYGTGPKPFYLEPVAENLYVSLIEQAQKSLWIMTPYFVTERRIMDALACAAGRGVDVRIVTPHIPDKKTVYLQTKRNYTFFLRNGIRVYEYTPGFLHSKNVLMDDEKAVVGTINFDYRSLFHHYECAVLLSGTKTVADMKEDFLATFAVSEEMDEEKARLSLPAKLSATLGILLSPLL